MATELEENYIYNQLNSGNSILEFGPGNCEFARKFPEYKFVGVDLYPFVQHSNLKKPNNMEYIQGNLLDETVLHKIGGRKFDTIICLSSFEHAGIEQAHFSKQQISGKHTVDLKEDYKILEKFKSLLNPSGRIIMTLPGGKDSIYFVDNNSKSYRYHPDKMIENIVWGFRTYTVNSINALLFFNSYLKPPLFKIVNKETKAFKREPVDSDYFAIDSWKNINPDELDNLNYLEQNGLLCVTLEQNAV